MKRLKENTNPKFEHIGDYLEQLKASIPSLIVTPYNIQFFHVEWEIINTTRKKVYGDIYNESP